METSKTDNTWIGLSAEPLPVGRSHPLGVRPSTGAIVSFNGIARNHSEGRSNVTVLEYEAYEQQVIPRLQAIADRARLQWPSIVKIVMIHRIGKVEIGDSAVVIAVSSPHRDHAFEASRFCIDTLKSTVPIWKRKSGKVGKVGV